MSFVAALVSCVLVSSAGDPPGPAPAAPATPAASAPATGLIPGVRIGPKLSVLPAPALFGVGLEARIKDTVGLSVDYGLLPELHVPSFSDSTSAPGVSNEISNGRFSYQDRSFAARWIPWGGSFHLGAAYGIRTFKASATGTATSSGLSVSGVASLRSTSTYLAPELGWRWIWSSGFFMGLDLGWQLVLSQKTSVDVPSDAFTTSKIQDYQDLANKLASTGLPVVSLLQLGWYL